MKTHVLFTDERDWRPFAAWARRRQRRYEKHRRAWSEAVGRAEVILPLAEPGPLTVVETDA